MRLKDVLKIKVPLPVETHPLDIYEWYLDHRERYSFKELSAAVEKRTGRRGWLSIIVHAAEGKPKRYCRRQRVEAMPHRSGEFSPEKLDDPLWLYEMFITRNHTKKAIAYATGTSITKVTDMLHQHGIRRPRKTLSKSWLMQRYVHDGLSMKRIAQLSGTHLSYVSRQLDKYGISHRHSGESASLTYALEADKTIDKSKGESHQDSHHSSAMH